MSRTIAQHLQSLSKEICAMNGCTVDEHHCESYAYIDSEMNLLDVCQSDYFQGTSKPCAAVCLPWIGTQAELEEEVLEQCDEQQSFT